MLADDRVAYDLMYTGGEAPEWERIKALLGVEGELRPPDPRKPEEAQNGAVAVWNIPDELVPAVEERVAGSASLYLRERIERTYPTNLAAQVVGYTQQADPVRNPGYSVNDLVGVAGIEAAYEAALFGHAGSRQVEVDSGGAEVASHVLWSAQPGYDVVLTLDPQLQRLAEDVLQRSLAYVNEDRVRVGLPTQDVAKGAIIALDPRTGEVLAMASSPTYDQNVFTHRPSDPEAVGKVLQNEDNPLTNRAVERAASTYKVVTSSTLLEHSYAAPRALPCTAAFRFGGIIAQLGDVRQGHVRHRHAIADSCNTYYWYAVQHARVLVGLGPVHRGPRRALSRARLRPAHGRRAPRGEGRRIPDEQWVQAQPRSTTTAGCPASRSTP